MKALPAILKALEGVVVIALLGTPLCWAAGPYTSSDHAEFFHGDVVLTSIVPESGGSEVYFYIREDRAVEPPTGRVEASSSAGWSSIQGKFWRAGGIAPGLRGSWFCPPNDREGGSPRFPEGSLRDPYRESEPWSEPRPQPLDCRAAHRSRSAR